MYIKKHGIPGIGITGKTGIAGKDGPGIYFGPLDSFFIFIGDDILRNSNKDYDDINYDITYVQNEKRLNYIYKTGDILYITSEDEDNKNILYMVEITDDLTTCTKNYFINHIKHYQPFTIKFNINENTVLYPINIVYSKNNDNETNKNIKNLFNLNKIYTQAALSIIYSEQNKKLSKHVINLNNLNNETITYGKHDFKHIPLTYDTSLIKNEYINNGKNINQYTYSDNNTIDSSNVLINFELTQQNQNLPNVKLDIKTIKEKYISLSTKNTVFNNIYVDNLFIKNTNIGNIDSYYTLYNPELILDNDGNCFTLSYLNYNDNTQTLLLDTSAFFKNRYNSHDNYKFGYIHMQWNYTEDTSFLNNTHVNYYQPNYITGTLTSDKPETLKGIIKTDGDGNYIRNWQDPSFIEITNIPIRELLINTTDRQTLNNVSNLLPDTVSKNDIQKYLNYKGIIETDNKITYPIYDFTQTLNGTIYKNYHDKEHENILLLSNVIQESEKYYISEKDVNINNLNIGHCQPVIYKTNSTSIIKFIKSDIFYDFFIQIYVNNDGTIRLDSEYYDNCDIKWNLSTNIPYYNIYIDENTLINENDLNTWIDSPYVDADRIMLKFRNLTSDNYLILKAKIIDPTDTENILTWNLYCQLNFNDSSNNNFNDIINQYIDTSFNSSIIYKYDFSEQKIPLYLTDKFNNQYRHHDIVQWVQTPNGIKYYSKHTYANFNYQYNTYDITTSWDTENNIQSLPGFIDTSTLGDNKLFNINIIKNSGNNYTLIIDASTHSDQPYVKKLEIYQDSFKISNTENIPISGKLTKTVFINNTEEDESLNTNILNDLYLNKQKQVDNKHILFTIKYALFNETTCTHIVTYDFNINAYNEYRTLPIIDLYCYNNMEKLEQLNNVSNGILSNQFQYFVNIKIKDFNKDNWGNIEQVKTTIKPKLQIELKIDNIIKDIDEHDINDIEGFKITYSLIKPNIDIFNTTQKELENEINIFNTEISNDTIICLFDIDDIYDDSYKLRILIETENPEPIYIDSHIYVNNLKIIAGDNEYVLNHEYLVNDNKILYDSEHLKAVIAPISMIAGYNQIYPNLSHINYKKWYGDESEITISIKPYRLDTVSQRYSGFIKRQESNIPEINWDALKFKLRYLQDNVKSIIINPLNINYIKDIIPHRLYIDEYLAQDPDDIYDSYLQLIYNSELLNTELVEDSEVFTFNNKYLYASEYGQFANNTALFIRQNIEQQLRTDSLLNSMQIWNELYKSYKYDSDNPFEGHLQTYGNGYQYLENIVDTGQYLSDGYMLLKDVKTVNNGNFFDLTNNMYIENTICKAKFYDNYTPYKLYRVLLYNMKWVYPYYTTENNINIIKQILIDKCILNENEFNLDYMPYNLTYSLYPRIMFNDEEQVNIILMLRCPTIINDEPDNIQQEMTVNDLNLLNVDIIQQLTDPINVMN